MSHPDRPFLERLYGLLLRLYPAAVRERWGRDMVELFRDLCRDERRHRGARGVAVLALRACAEVPPRALLARRDERRQARALLPRRRNDRREDVMGSLLQDLRFTFRTLAKNPTTTVVAVLSLALGIGANTTIFSVLNAVFLRPLPYPEPERLVLVAPDLVAADGAVDELGVWSYPYFTTLRRHAEVFAGAAPFTAGALNLTGSETPDRVRVEYVGSPYFGLLGVDARLGRTFLPRETAAEAEEAVVLLQDGTWKRRFGADPGVLGRTIHLNGIEHTVVGVLPPGFEGLSQGVEIWVPFPMIQRLVHPRRLAMAHGFWHNAVARLRDGVTLEQAVASFPALAAAMTEELPLHPLDADKTMRLNAIPLAEARVDAGLRAPLTLLLGAVALVLLIACANVANLLLSRALARRREVGVRVALGAERGRLVRQFLTESAVLGLASGGTGLLFAVLGIQGLKTVLPRATPGTWTRYAEAVDGSAIIIDARVLLFTLALALVATCLFGLAPAFGATRADVRSALAVQEPARRTAGRRIPRGALVVAQMALAVVLLAGAGLVLRSLDEMRRSDPGFNPENVLTARLALPRDPYNETAGSFLDELRGRLSRRPGVEAVSLAVSLPLLNDEWSTVMEIQGEEDTGARKPVGYHVVGSDHLRTLGIPLLAGRPFDDGDRVGAPLVALVNQAAAREYWGDEDPVGRRIWLGMGFEEEQWAEVVGVVGDVHYGALGEPVRPDVYVPMTQWPERHVVVLLRTAGDPLALVPDLRREVAALDADLPIYNAVPLAEATAASRSHARFLAVLLGTFAALALVLAATGVYGVMAFAVTRRTHEVGVRLALGARRDGILRLVLADGLVLALLGAGLGLAATVYLTRFLASQLYGVSALDPWTLAATAAVLVLVALAATWRPAWRAGRVDPMAVLRNE